MPCVTYYWEITAKHFPLCYNVLMVWRTPQVLVAAPAWFHAPTKRQCESQPNSNLHIAFTAVSAKWVCPLPRKDVQVPVCKTLDSGSEISGRKLWDLPTYDMQQRFGPQSVAVCLLDASRPLGHSGINLSMPSLSALLLISLLFLLLRSR